MSRELARMHWVAAENRREQRCDSATAAACPLPSPEKVFADWLRSVPRGADLCAAAREQIALIDRRASPHPDLQFLRRLLAAVAGECTWRKPFANL